MVQGQVGLPHCSSADQGSPAGGLLAATRLSTDPQPCCWWGSSSSRRWQAGRQRWSLPCCKHLLSMSTRQNTPTLLIILFSTLFPRVPHLLLKTVWMGQWQVCWGCGQQGHFSHFTNRSGSVLSVYTVPHTFPTLEVTYSVLVNTQGIIHQAYRFQPDPDPPKPDSRWGIGKVFGNELEA